MRRAEELLLALSLGKDHDALINPLQGDASSRSYLHARFNDEVMVVMKCPETGSVDLFAEMTGIMRSLGADTPTIYARNGRYMALEDCGDDLLQKYVSVMNDDAISDIYQKVIDDLIRFQAQTKSLTKRESDCFALALDIKKLSFETSFTLEHFIEGFLRVTLTDSERETLDSEWTKVVHELALKVETLCHRDFHSRNILCHKGRRVWIDYQDARMGRMTYDLASLLEDPYVDLPVALREEFCEYYFIEAGKAGLALWNRDEFGRLYRFSAMQRIYKALGTFGYQANSLNVNTYIPFMAPAMRTLLRLTTDPLTPLLERFASRL